MILVPLLNPKFANTLGARPCELRVRGTSTVPRFPQRPLDLLRVAPAVFPAVALHLIKLCVGCDSVRDLEDCIRQKIKERRKRGLRREHMHRTRMVPKRADELCDGGSLYWVIRGEIMCRQRILDVRPFTDRDGIGRCYLVLQPKPVLVEPRP